MQKTLTARAPARDAREYEYDYGLYNGRFQIVHEGHLAAYKAVSAKCRRPIINIGSIEQSRDTRNPLDFEQRRRIWEIAIKGEFGEDAWSRTTIIGQRDLGNPVRWASEVEGKVSQVIASDGMEPDEADVAIYGRRKDATSYYLDDFPRYVLEPVDQVDALSATHLREQMFEISNSAYASRWLSTQVPRWNEPVLRAFMDTPAFSDLLIEYKKISDAEKRWAGSPYPVIFCTADAIIVQGNRVLMVKRKFYPGKGLWALPGGFVEHRERVLEAAIRESTEETNLAVSRTVLRKSLVETFFEDDPWRSTGGRRITFPSIFHLRPTPKGKTPAERRKSMALPYVKDGDDAEIAAWKTFDEIREMRPYIYEDHAILIDKALDRLGLR